MFKNIFGHIKSGMSLIELLVVITVIGILIAVLVPQIGNTQAKSRDITRQTQVQELVAALMSYKLDYGEFPTISETINVGDIHKEQYRGKTQLLNSSLVAGGYMKKIPQDPVGLKFLHTLNESEVFNYDSAGYYLYMSDGKSFAIITLVEDEKNGNVYAGDNGSDLIPKLVNDSYEDVFNDTIATNSSGGNLYVYKYEDEVL